MNYAKYPRNSYIPTRPKLLNKHDKFDLDARMQQMTFNEIIQNPDNYFENVFITNVDLIHNQCRGDKLKQDRKYCETLFKEKLNLEINDINQRDCFVFAAISSERKDVYIEKKIYKDQFNRKLLREKLNKNGVFLSNILMIANHYDFNFLENRLHVFKSFDYFPIFLLY